VAAARAELADVAPGVLALFGQLQQRYQRIEATFNELVPRAEGLASDEVWQVPWAESGALQLQERLDDFADRLLGLVER